MAGRSIKMSDAVTAKILELAKKARGSVKVGFIDNNQAPIAFWNNFGHKGNFPAPPRPFFTNMVNDESPKWPNMMAAELKRSKFDGKTTLAFMGEEIEGSLKQSIVDFDSVPLAASTIRRKGFDKQLINKGDMLRSTSYKVD
jgi:hypothetical protein